MTARASRNRELQRDAVRYYAKMDKRAIERKGVRLVMRLLGLDEAMQSMHGEVFLAPTTRRILTAFEESEA